MFLILEEICLMEHDIAIVSSNALALVICGKSSLKCLFHRYAVVSIFEHDTESLFEFFIHLKKEILITQRNSLI